MEHLSYMCYIEVTSGAALMELSTIDPPTYERYVTAEERTQFGADLAIALDRLFDDR